MEVMHTRRLNLGIIAVSFLFVLLIAGCHNPPSIEETLASLRSMQPTRSQNSSVENERTDNSSQIDSRTAPMDSVTYWKMVRDSCPELFRKVPLSPYEAYDKCRSGYFVGGGCESCIDNYFKLYAKVLRRKSGKEMKPIRNDTQEALRLLNYISHELSGGGTFYGHMMERSEGEMEHSLYKYEHGEMDFSAIDLDKERSTLFRKWKKSIHKSITREGGMNFSGVRDVELEKQLLDSLSRMKTLVKTPFTLTYLDEFGRRFYSDLKF
jgi:hypothetical protein